MDHDRLDRKHTVLFHTVRSIMWSMAVVGAGWLVYSMAQAALSAGITQ